MDPDGLETLHSFFAQYPRYNTNVCIHHLPSIYILDFQSLDRDELCTILATEHEVNFLQGNNSMTWLGQLPCMSKRI